MNLHGVHGFNDDPRVLGRLEVRKGQAPKDAVVEVVVEGIGLRQVHFEHDGCQRLLAHGKGDVLNDNGRGDELVPVRGGRSEVGRGVRGALFDTETAVLHVASVEAAREGLQGVGHAQGGVIGPVLDVGRD